MIFIHPKKNFQSLLILTLILPLISPITSLCAITLVNGCPNHNLSVHCTTNLKDRKDIGHVLIDPYDYYTFIASIGNDQRSITTAWLVLGDLRGRFVIFDSQVDIDICGTRPFTWLVDESGLSILFNATFKNEVVLSQDMVVKNQMSSSELRNLEEELQLLKAAGEMVFDNEESVQFHIEELTKQVELKRWKLEEMKFDRGEREKTLQEKKGNLKNSLLELNPETYAKFTRYEQVEVEIESVLAEIKRREEEISKLTSDLEKQPKMAPRKSHIERINEITKNSRKQDADIQRILKDTREVQLESNTIQERLNRTYAVVDETIFREAKKDPVARQAYRLLAKMHESFEQIAEKIIAADRSRRDAADYEAKLAAMGDRNLNLEKVKLDLDAIRKENELLEQRLGKV